MTTSIEKPKVFGAGLIALDLVMGINPQSPVQSWAGGTCGNVLSILAFLGWDAFPVARLNGDPASERVKADMARWGVRLDFVGCSPTSHTPIVIQEIRRGRNGSPTHRFSWSCPRCGQWLPSFKSVTLDAVETVAPSLPKSSVFFMDRLSRAALRLAVRASDEGAIVIFEPSSRSDPTLFAEALRIAHIVKYSDQRLAAVDGVMRGDSATLLEVKTLGAEGLKYRHRLGRTASEWAHLSAVPAPRLSDSCGSGDWCTAGLLAKVAVGGQKGFRSGGAAAIKCALRYGQVLAAWNCGFEGARGGMYAVDRETFMQQVEALVSGRKVVVTEVAKTVQGSVVPCPACPPDEPRGKRRGTTASRRTIKRVSAA
jgi:sugar/nucleoside kinase (ribokinase family)